MNLFENIEKLINNRKIENKISKEEDTIKIENNNISQSEADLAQKLDAIENFTVDRIEEDIAILEDRSTGKLYDIKKEELPDNIKSGDIIKKINGKFFMDQLETKSVKKRIEDKMNDLWN